MTGIPDELVEKAAWAIPAVGVREGESVMDAQRRTARVALEAVGLPALLERVEAAEGHAGRPDADLAAARRLYEWVAEIREAEADPDWDDLDVMAQAAWLQGARHVGTDALAAKVADAGERIALAIEKANRKVIDARVADDYTRPQIVDRVLTYAAQVARSALTEGTEG